MSAETQATTPPEFPVLRLALPQLAAASCVATHWLRRGYL